MTTPPATGSCVPDAAPASAGRTEKTGQAAPRRYAQLGVLAGRRSCTSKNEGAPARAPTLCAAVPELKRGAEDYEEYEAKGPDGSTRQSWRPSNGKLNLVRGLDARPQIIVTNRHLHELSDEAWAAVKRSNYPAWLFRHGGQIAEIGRDEEDRPVIVHLKPGRPAGTARPLGRMAA